MGKSAEILTLIPETDDTVVDEDDVAWLRDLVARYSADSDDSKEVERDETGEPDLDDLAPEEELAMQFELDEATRVRKPGKGGTKPKNGTKDGQRNKRATQLREEQVRNSREKRNEEATSLLQTQLDGSELLGLVRDEDEDAEFFVETYAHWVRLSIENHGDPVLNKGDIVVENFRRARGPGGQNMQKGESARRAGHIWSGIVVEANNRSSEQSEREAIEKLDTKLREHVATWESYIGTANIDVKPNESIWDARERTVRTQVYKMARKT